MRKTLIILLSVAAVFGAGLLLYALLKGEKEAFIRTTGTVEGTEVNLSSKVSGEISYICCKEGDAVASGAIALRLESEDLRASMRQAVAAVSMAEADVLTALASIEAKEAEVKSSGAELNAAHAEYKMYASGAEQAKAELTRAEALFIGGFTSKADIDLKTNNYDALKAAVDAASARMDALEAKKAATAAALKMSKNQYESSKAALNGAKEGLSYFKAKLDDTVISSPISGVVVFKAAEAGEVVSPGSAILTLVDLNDLSVRTDIDESRIAQVKLGSEAVIKAQGKAFKGSVSEIGRYADFATQRDVVRGRQDIKTFRVKIRLKDTGGILKPGMTVDVEIPVS
jgi:HlyD family secretion protein